MSLLSIEKILKENNYPGRGIIAGMTPDSAYAVTAYFIMGRSVNSRNRVFVQEGENLRTKAFDESKLSDPSLIIYYPVRALENQLIVTNGDQTDTVYDYIKAGKTFEEALCTREFEPDAPNFTPRISAILAVQDGKYSYKLSILKSALMNGASCERFTYDYASPIPGEGRFIHTYRCDGNPIPSFTGDPEPIAIEGDIDSFTTLLWESLNEDNKVSLFVRYLPLNGGEAQTRVVNKN